MNHRLAVATALCLFASSSFAAITGTVMNRDGAPVAGARVSIHALETMQEARVRLLSAKPERATLAVVETDARGNFSFESPKEAVVSLRILARGYLPVEEEIERDDEAGAIALSKAEMTPGTVTAAGKPVEEATVSALYDGVEYVTRTDASGRYELPARHRAQVLRAMHPDHALVEIEAGENAGLNAKNTRITLTPGRPLAGVVVGNDGKSPVPDAVIAIDGWPMSVSTKDGSFRIEHAPETWSVLTAQTGDLGGQLAYAKEPSVSIRMQRAVRVAGRVTDATSRLPLALASIRFNPTGAGAPATAYTDAKGMYSISLAPGSYRVAATRAGYGLSTNALSAVSEPMTRDHTLPPLARISGIVMSDEKKPVAAAMVRADATEESPIWWRRRAATGIASGPDGRFRLRVAGEGDVVVRAAKRGFPEGESDRIHLAAGEKKSGLVIVIPSGIEVTGRVTDAAGNPLSGIAVSTSASTSGPRNMMIRRIVGAPSDSEEETVRTASDGTYALRVKEGAWDFTFGGEGWSRRVVRAQNVTPGDPVVVDASLEPSVEITGRVVRNGAGVENARIAALGEGQEIVAVSGPDGSFVLSDLPRGRTRVMIRKDDDFIDDMRTLTAPSTDVVIDLPAGGRVVGRVTDKSSGNPITTFRAGVSTSRGGPAMVRMSPPQMRDFSSDDGSFVLENVPAGANSVVAEAPGYATSQVTVTVEEGKTVRDVAVALEPGVRLFGRVTGPGGDGIPEARVELVRSSNSTFGMPGMIEAAITDANGEYSFESLPPAERTIAFSHSRHASVRKSVTLKGRETRLDAQLPAGLEVSGSVVTESGAPVPDAEVRAWSANAGRPRQTRSDARGAFQLQGLEEGRYQIQAEKSGFVDAVLDDVDLSTGAPLQLVLGAGGTIFGHVTGLSAAELSNVTVSARSGASSAATMVGADGNYRLQGAPTGSVIVAANVASERFAGTRAAAPQTIQLAAGAEQRVDIEFRGDVVVRGRVTRNGTPLRGAIVQFMPRGNTNRARGGATTDEDARYSIAGLEEGQYDVHVIDDGRLTTYTTTYEVHSSAAFDIDFSAANLRGRVIDAATSEPLANAAVDLRPAGSSPGFRMSRSATTDMNGTFAFEAISPGAFVISTSKAGFGSVVTDLTMGDTSRDDLEIKLSSASDTTFTVVDARDGSALSAAIFVYDLAGRVVHEERGGTAGNEQKISLPAGSYTASILAGGLSPRNIRFQAPSSQRVALTPGGTLLVRSSRSQPLRLRLIDGGGLPYPRFSSLPSDRNLLPSPSTTTIESLAPDTYVVQVLGDNDAVIEWKQVTVQAGQTLTLDL